MGQSGSDRVARRDKNSAGQITGTHQERLGDPKAALDRINKTYEVALKNLKKLEDAGVTIAAGTDAGNIGTIHGPALFREFQLMKEAGLTPCRSCNARPRTLPNFSAAKPARCRQIDHGNFADLVILNSNPFDDIAHASDIDTVIKNGVAYPAIRFCDDLLGSARSLAAGARILASAKLSGLVLRRMDVALD